MAARSQKSPFKRGQHIKVTREDWLQVALDLLVSEGVEQVRILTISDRLGVSRSSFYWYFKSREDLHDALIAHWDQTNTAAILSQCTAPSATITEAVCNLFKCFLDDSLYNYRLDFAVREWARRSGPVRRVVDLSDMRRLNGIAEMFLRHGYTETEAEVRARILYYMQVGYYALELKEALEERLSFIPGYLHGFTGQEATEAEVEAFRTYARAAVQNADQTKTDGGAAIDRDATSPIPKTLQ